MDSIEMFLWLPLKEIEMKAIQYLLRLGENISITQKPSRQV